MSAGLNKALPKVRAKGHFDRRVTRFESKIIGSFQNEVRNELCREKSQ